MLYLLAATFVAAGSPVAKVPAELAQDLRHAETYYALGLLDPDSATAARGMSWAESASHCPNSTADESLAVDQKKLDQQAKAAAGKLNSVFPLTRFFKPAPFSEMSIGSEYDLTGNAAADAAIDAAGQALARVAAAEKGVDSVPVLFVVLPPPAYLQSAADGDGAPAQWVDRQVDRPIAQWDMEQLGGSLAASMADYPQFAAHQVFELKPLTRDSIRDVLSKTDSAELPKTLADQIAAELAASSKKSKVLVIVVRMKDAVENVYDCTADAYLLAGAPAQRVDGTVDPLRGHPTAPTGGTATEVDSGNAPPVFPNFTVSSLRVDRHNRAGLILLANVLLLVLACVLHRFITATHSTMISERSWKFGLLAALTAFAIGRAVPYAIAPTVGALHVSPAASAAAAFWYPCLLGLGLIGLPLIAYWLASYGLARHWSLLSVDVRGGALFAAVGTGIAAYMASPLLLYEPLPKAVIDCVLMAISIVIVAYLAGRSLDRADPLSTHIAAPLLTIIPALVGLAVLSADVRWLSVCSTALVAVAGVVVMWDRARKPPGLDADAERPLPQAGDASINQELARRAENPDYQQSARVQSVFERFAPLLRGEACHVVVVGQPGAGKTATVDAAVARFVRDFSSRASHGGVGGKTALQCATTVLRGSSPAPGCETIAFAPFRQALARHFAIDFFAESEPKLQQISQALGGIVGSFIPFSTILFHHSAGDGAAAINDDQINSSIAWMLRRLADPAPGMLFRIGVPGARPVILLLDDAQWLDEASMSLVKRLVEEFPAGERPPLAIVLVSSDLEPLKILGIDEKATIEVGYPSRDEQVQILVQGVGLNKDVANEILDRVGEANELRSGLHWPLQVVAQLARAGAFVPADGGFVWAGGCWPADFQIPSHIEAIIERQLAEAAKYRTILECAACCADGREFNASLVAAASIGRAWTCWSTSMKSSARPAWCANVRDRDDIYEFHSWFLVEKIRKTLGLDGGGAGNAGPIPATAPIVGGGFALAAAPQIAREYHGRLAAALEGIPAASANRLFDLATYYYIAGVRYAPKGVDHCLRAADAAASMCDFAAANRYLQMAEHSGSGPKRAGKSRWLGNSSIALKPASSRAAASGPTPWARFCST